MKRMPAFAGVAVVLVGLLVLSGCRNGNLFGGLHKRGDSGNIEYLLSDASVALKEKDYAGALALYERVLAQNPSNSEALYGAAVAAIGSSGLNFGTIVNNVVGQNAAVSSLGIKDLIAQAQETGASVIGDSTSILHGVDRDALLAVIDTAICRLNRIVAGATDGSIQRDDIDVLLNLGSLCLIRAVLKPLARANLLDVQNTSGQYDVEVDSAAFTAICSNPSDAAFVGTIARDLAGAWALFNRAVNLLNLGSDKIISEIRQEIVDVANVLLPDESPDGPPQILPQQCLDVFQANGITLGNFTSYNDVFDAPSGC